MKNTSSRFYYHSLFLLFQGKNGNFISRNSCGGDVYFSGFMFVVNRASCLVGSFKINETSYITDKLSEL